MTFYTQSSNGAAVPCNPYSTEEERMESEHGAILNDKPPMNLINEMGQENTPQYFSG